MIHRTILLILIFLFSCILETPKNIDELVTKFRLSKYNTELKQLTRNAILLEAITKKDDDIPVGTSKIGGLPDLPKNIEIPKWNGKSLSFICQLNLNEISYMNVDSLLPNTGILYFFYNQGQETWGFDFKDKGSFKVVYYPDKVDSLKRIHKPNDLEMIFNSCTIKPNITKNIPSYNSKYIDSLKLNSEENDRYFDLEMYINEEGTIHKLFGYPNQIQGDMQYECPLVTKGLYLGDATGYNDPKLPEYLKEYDNWILLLQIDSDPKTGMMWGDLGRIYYWIKKDDLLKENFDDVWMILQCS